MLQKATPAIIAISVVVGASCLGTFVVATSLGRFLPPRFQSGIAAPIDTRAVGGGEVFVEANVTDTGVVSEVRPLRVTPPFTEMVTTSVGQWKFSPAIQELNPDPDDEPQVIVKRPVTSKVLVAAMFRAPTLNNGPTLGTAPKDVAMPSDDTPFPIATVMPTFPVNAIFDGTVLIEVHIGTDGHVLGTKVLQSAAVFDAPALDAVKKWVFRPARARPIPADSYAYVSFGFRQPVTNKGG